MSKVFPIILYYNVGENLKNKTFNIPPNISIKSFVEKFNIPTVPGYSKELPENESRLKKIVSEIGYPIILKATSIK